MENLGQYYNLFSAYYDPKNPEAQRRASQTLAILQPVLDNLKVTGRTKVLDLCCGSGLFSFALAEQGFHVLGVDALAFQIDKAKTILKEKEKLISCRFVVSDILELSLPTAEFDACFLLGNSVAHFSISKMSRLFERVHQWLSDGGLFIVEYGDFILNFLEYREIMFEGLTSDGRAVVSFHDRYDADSGFVSRRFCDLASGKTFLLKLFIWMPSVLRYIAQHAGFELKNSYIVSHLSNIGERRWVIDVFTF